MATKASMERVKENAQLTKQTITALKSELVILNNDYNMIRAQQLREENTKLTEAVELAKKCLIQLEVKNGIKQIPVPNAAITDAVVQFVDGPITDENKDVKSKKEKKVKEEKDKAAPLPEAPIDVGRLDLRIAKVIEVQRHPDADSLYLLKIDCGEEKLRTVCSGLVKFVSIEELKDRDVVILCNLKPVKMRGIISEAMVMCASTPEKVEVLLPPKGCFSGELVHCNGYVRQPDAVMNPKKKIFETVAPDLHTNESLQACYRGVPFSIPGKGNIVSKSLKNVSVK